MKTTHAWLLLGVAPVAMAIPPSFSPETTVDLNLRWLSPPQVSPQNGQAVAEQTEGAVRITARYHPDGVDLTWPLRYAVPVRNYPTVTLRYRASDLLPHPGTGDTFLRMSLLNPAGEVAEAVVAYHTELIQDGMVHEIRKDLGEEAGDSAITDVSFLFNAPDSSGQLEILGLRFEQGPASPAPFLHPREDVEFIVTDAAGTPIADAEVHAGLVERANWTRVGTTDAAGQSAFPVVRPVRPDGTIVDPVEAMVLKPGFIPQYVAPIEFPRTGPVRVRLTSAAQPPPAGAIAVGQEPERTLYVPARETVVYYESYPSVSYVDTFALGWWIPTYYCGYRPYYRSDRQYYHYRYGCHYDWHRPARDRDRHDRPSITVISPTVVRHDTTRWTLDRGIPPRISAPPVQRDMVFHRSPGGRDGHHPPPGAHAQRPDERGERDRSPFAGRDTARIAPPRSITIPTREPPPRPDSDRSRPAPPRTPDRPTVRLPSAPTRPPMTAPSGRDHGDRSLRDDAPRVTPRSTPDTRSRDSRTERARVSLPSVSSVRRSATPSQRPTAAPRGPQPAPARTQAPAPRPTPPVARVAEAPRSLARPATVESRSPRTQTPAARPSAMPARPSRVATAAPRPAQPTGVQPSRSAAPAFGGRAQAVTPAGENRHERGRR